eukprot:TRINITY_DN23159_c0_g1_i1.p1 TRINITY_DN23159_c0_g1~~TRINITY_DN23159_c0_g1_i1.p1  ORF type:complete len:145 (+),score=40.94 TRINITY_DN23159_c0_g1_i1:81-515(+)
MHPNTNSIQFSRQMDPEVIKGKQLEEYTSLLGELIKIQIQTQNIMTQLNFYRQVVIKDEVFCDKLERFIFGCSSEEFMMKAVRDPNASKEDKELVLPVKVEPDQMKVVPEQSTQSKRKSHQTQSATSKKSRTIPQATRNEQKET